MIQRQARAAQLADAEAMSNLLQDVFAETYAKALDDLTLQSHLRTYLSVAVIREDIKTSSYFLSEGDQGLAGVIKLVLDDTKKAEIDKLYVRSEARALGVGKELMKAALEWAEQKAIRGLWLKVWEQNPSAIRFYESQGFKKVGLADVYVGETVFKDFVMEKNL